MHRGWAARFIGLCGFALGVSTVPSLLCRSGTADWYEGHADKQAALANRVARWVDEGQLGAAFATGSPRFDSEWIFGTYQMAALGFGQVAQEHPETEALQRARMERAIDRMLSPLGQRFDAEAWGEGPLASLDNAPGHDNGHVAYLGYANLVLSYHRSLFPDSRYAELNDEVSATLERRLSASPTLLVETYPGEIYPVDNSAAIASIGLHALATGHEFPLIVGRWMHYARDHYVDRESGLLYQSVHADGSRLDAPRGSGTALAAYFLSFADPGLSRELHEAVQRTLARDVLGFRAVREYPPGRVAFGDIDSGPVVLGFGVSATGFSIAGCRMYRDADCYQRTLATAQLFGSPLERKGELGYVSGGPIGDAILFAMQTARRSAS